METLARAVAGLAIDKIGESGPNAAAPEGSTLESKTDEVQVSRVVILRMRMNE